MAVVVIQDTGVPNDDIPGVTEHNVGKSGRELRPVSVPHPPDDLYILDAIISIHISDPREKHRRVGGGPDKGGPLIRPEASIAIDAKRSLQGIRSGRHINFPSPGGVGRVEGGLNRRRVVRYPVPRRAEVPDIQDFQVPVFQSDNPLLNLQNFLLRMFHPLICSSPSKAQSGRRPKGNQFPSVVPPASSTSRRFFKSTVSSTLLLNLFFQSTRVSESVIFWKAIKILLLIR